jgi:hypothetical protein
MAATFNPTPYTLLIEDRGARLWGAEGTTLAELPAMSPGPDRRRAWGELLQKALPPKARVELLLAHGQLVIQCQEAPFLRLKEQQEVGARLGAASFGGEAFNLGCALDLDSFAEGGHQLWVAAQPEGEILEWLGALRQAGGAEMLCAAPMAWVLLKALDGLQAWPKDRLVLALERDTARIFFYRGQGLAFSRSFRLPDQVDVNALGETGEEVFTAVVGEEIARVLQFIKQKHRGVSLETLNLVGLPSLSKDHQASLDRALRLKVRLVAPSLPHFLRGGLDAERDRRGTLNMVPQEVLDVRRTRLLRVAAWASALLMVVLGAGLFLWLQAAERAKIAEADQAEAMREQRRARFQERERAVRARFGPLRVRFAEQNQARAIQQLEGLGICLLEVPKGIVLERVEVVQNQANPLQWRFTVAGTALSEGSFSVSPLAQYVAHLRAHPGLQLWPIREVSVSDRGTQGPRSDADQRAVTTFVLEGIAP